jgi:hypothetical protein
MKCAILVSSILLFGCCFINAQDKTPRFEQYPVTSKFSGKPMSVNLSSHPMARKYRTMLRRAVKDDGVNFAGKYIITWWGCGTECQYIAIIDATNGRVYFAPFNTSYGIGFRKNSRLLITEPPEKLNERFIEDEPGRPDTVYFKWTGRRLILLYPKKPKQIIDRYPDE